MNWLLAEAKNRFSEVVTLALTSGPQRVQRRDKAVIILAEEEYQQLTGERSRFLDFLMQGPSLTGLDISRDKSSMRDVDL
jgi:hypothetical protein